MDPNKIAREMIVDIIARLEKRIERGAGECARMEGYESEYAAMKFYFNELGELLLEIHDRTTGMRDCTFGSVLDRMKIILICSLQGISMGPDKIDELAKTCMSVVATQEQMMKDGQSGGIMAFNRLTKRFENVPEGLKDVVAKAEAIIAKMDDPTPEQVVSVLMKESSGGTDFASIDVNGECTCPECTKKANVAGNNTMH